MTPGEIDRLFKSKVRMQKQRAQEQATFDYTLADLIGRSVARIYNSSNHMPEISEVYPTLFDQKEFQEKKQEHLDNLSAARFKQFAQSFNQKFTGGGKD
jgi:hypothetical protein